MWRRWRLSASIREMCPENNKILHPNLSMENSPCQAPHCSVLMYSVHYRKLFRNVLLWLPTNNESLKSNWQKTTSLTVSFNKEPQQIKGSLSSCILSSFCFSNPELSCFVSSFLVGKASSTLFAVGGAGFGDSPGFTKESTNALLLFTSSSTSCFFDSWPLQKSMSHAPENAKHQKTYQKTHQGWHEFAVKTFISTKEHDIHFLQLNEHENPVVLIAHCISDKEKINNIMEVPWQPTFSMPLKTHCPIWFWKNTIQWKFWEQPK